MTGTTTPAHETKVIVFRSRDEWQGVVTCTCGWKDNTASGPSSSAADASASAKGRAHVRSNHASSAQRVAGNIGGMLLVAAIALIPVLLIVGVISKVSGGDDPAPPRPSEQSTFEQDGSGVDCDKAVTYLMTEEYGGGWGSDKWPIGEHPRRVAECERE